MQEWTKVDIFTSTVGIEPVCASLMELGIAGFQVTDPNDLDDFLEGKAGYWDYYDEELLKLRDAEAAVTVYLAGNEQGAETLAAIKQELNRLKRLDEEREWGRLEYALSGAREEDWANEWKKYYHPVKIGARLVVCPSWEEYSPDAGDVVIRLDPGMAFGTGTHESTRLCMQLMEKYLTPDIDVLDVGCGSGILGISAVLLGARVADGLDIDEVAVRVANENAALNGAAERCAFVREALGDRIEGRYGIVFANIVADVIIGHAQHLIRSMDDHGVLIVSGVIDAREDDVAGALTSAGLVIDARETDGGWVALACKINRQEA